jgi:hypothetical protein
MPAADGRQGAEIHRKVEVGTGKPLDESQPDEEVARLDPALRDDVLAEEGDDYRAAAEDDGAGEVHVCEEAVEKGFVGEGNAPDDDDCEEGEEEEGDEDGAELPGDV